MLVDLQMFTDDYLTITRSCSTLLYSELISVIESLHRPSGGIYV